MMMSSSCVILYINYICNSFILYIKTVVGLADRYATRVLLLSSGGRLPLRPFLVERQESRGPAVDVQDTLQVSCTSQRERDSILRCSSSAQFVTD